MASFDWLSLPAFSWIGEAFTRIGMDHAQWGYTLFDAGSYGYSSVTSHTLAPIIYAHRAAAQAAAAASAQSAASSVDGVTSLALESKFAFFGGNDITAYWVFMISTASLVAGLLCPIFGTIADLYSVRKAMTFVSALLSIIFLTIFAYCTSSVSIHWLLFYAGTAVMFSSLSHAFYNSLIMLVSGPHELVKVACIQASVGSFGAALLMTSLGLHNTEDLNRMYMLFAFSIAALWFVLLSLPMWFWLKEDPPSRDSTWQDIMMQSYLDMAHSLENVELIKFTVSALLMNDALATILAVYLVYGIQIGIPVHVLLFGAVFKRWTACGAALAWLGTSAYLSARSCLMISMVLGIVSIVLCAWMSNGTDFLIMCTFLTVSQSGCYIYQKVLMSDLTNKEKASHHFGFMSMASRVAGFLGPFLYTVVSLSISDRAAFMALVFMALAGLVMLSMVDFDKGRKFFESRLSAAGDGESAAASEGARAGPGSDLVGLNDGFKEV